RAAPPAIQELLPLTLRRDALPVRQQPRRTTLPPPASLPTRLTDQPPEKVQLLSAAEEQSAPQPDPCIREFASWRSNVESRLLLFAELRAPPLPAASSPAPLPQAHRPPWPARTRTRPSKRP